MNLAKNRNQDGTLITLTQACQESNLGATSVRKIAEEAGAVRKIGRSYRIKLKYHKAETDYIFLLWGW